MARAATWLEQDPDERTVRWGWVIWLAWGVIGGALFLTDIRAGTGALSLVLVAPFWGMWLLWPTYRFIRAWWRWQYEGAWDKSNGAYYEFDGRQIRIVMQGDSIWISADDVFDALGLHGRQRNVARVRKIAGRDGLVEPPGWRMLSFSEIGIKAWLDRRTDTVAHKFSYWLDKQVIAPYRKRREIEGNSGDENQSE
ncbi:MAG TPA: hypothetical protein VNA44_03375 [Burkholderiaceae bacterium]|nr:hypothetical protein [Burkholderiaceae bacterium]